MQHPQTKVLESFRRVTAFLPTLSLTADDGDVGPQVTELKGIVDRLAAHVVAQDAAQRLARANTQNKTALRRVLRHRHMLPISGVAQALLATPTGYAAALKTPPEKTRTATLAAAAGGMATAARPYEAMFVKHGLRAGFVARLEEATQALEAAIAVGAAQRVERGRATAAIKQDLRRGRVIVNSLNAIVKPAIAHDAGMLAAWRSAKHVERVAVRSPQYLGVYLSTPAGAVAVAPSVPAARTVPVATTPPATEPALGIVSAPSVPGVSGAAEEVRSATVPHASEPGASAPVAEDAAAPTARLALVGAA